MDAFNSGDVDRALQCLSPDAIVSDCDYDAGTQPSYQGPREIEAWLRARAADKDVIELDRLFNDNPTGPGHGVGLDHVRRSSGTLRSRGFTQGVEVYGAPKVAFAGDGRIRAFIYGNDQECKRVR
ncbi:MAG TPA: hypothetical protein VFM93_14740 [Candidatus Limnocylindria bacterium]|nr:hypothetical protein [Candidatus Limnocylindria bacterium]